MAAQTKKKVPSAKARGKIWLIAVDPFQTGDLQPLVQMVRSFGAPLSVRVELVYVMAPAGMNWNGDFSGPWIKRYLPLAEAKLAQVLPDEAGEKHVLVCKKAGQRAAVQTLLQFARKKKVAGVVVATHARTGLERWAMGSFAETLLLSSKIPVLVINPTTTLPSVMKKILFPVDLAPKCEKTVAAIASFAKAHGAEVVLYYKQDDPIDPIVQQGVYTLGGGWISLQTFADDDEQIKSQRLEKLSAIVRRQKVPVSHIFDSAPGSLVEGIGRAAKESGADVISLFTYADRTSAVLLGSVARSLVRQSPVPTLVQH